MPRPSPETSSTPPYRGKSFPSGWSSENASRSAPVYILSAGDADLLRLNAAYDKASRAWKVEPAPLDALHAEARTLTITVPEGSAVSVNGIALGEEYITDSHVPYTGISELETQFDTCPYRVTYTVPGIYETAQVDVSREAGVLLLYSDGTRFDYTVPDARDRTLSRDRAAEATVTAGGAPLSDAQAVSFAPLSTHVDVPDELAARCRSTRYTLREDFTAIRPLRPRCRTARRSSR